MKKILSLLLVMVVVFGLVACTKDNTTKQIPTDLNDAESVLNYLKAQNELFVESGQNTGDLSKEKREYTSENGQNPYAVIVTCSDSRVPAEHIFNAGIGELFVIKTAGNVIGDHALGSVEYGVDHLGIQLVVVLGHTHCGAVDAALNGEAHGKIASITDEIKASLPKDCDERTTEILNVENSIFRIKESEIIKEALENGVRIVAAIYDIESGEVNFFE